MEKTCISCNKRIVNQESSTEFRCPNCGKILIVRCEKCRILAKEYKCPNCGFTGP